METVKAVKEPVPDPKAGKSRARSGVSFPYFDLASAIEVAKAIHERAGGTCSLAQLAPLLGNTTIKSGSFRSRVSATKMFGLVEDADSGDLRVSQRGRAIVAPIAEQAEARARVEAFLAVELFHSVYERFEGMTLPQEVGLRNLLENDYEVVSDRVTPTVRIMLDSAEQAGFFQAAGNRSRMVMPLKAGRGSPPSPANEHAATKTDGAATTGVEGPDGRDGARAGGGGGGTGSTTIDPAFLGLLQHLPPVGTALSAKKRKSFIDAFTAAVDLVYPPDADGGSE